MQRRTRPARIASEAPGKEGPISTSVSPGITVDGSVDGFDVGTVPGSGTFFCSTCGSQLALRENERLPECPRCGAAEFQRDSIFEPMQDHGQTAELAVPATISPPQWLPEARAMLSQPGRYLARRDDDGEIEIFPIERGWTRIGRSAVADLRLDDPSVSRRHALIVSELPDSLRVLDDRSLNGILLNGELVEWGRLEDGDELTIGRYSLYVLDS
jgi:predicted  nucleic acid-binding Zn-ribbon protein